ncbi:MAG: DNA polymerase I, partial [Bacteroidales bacterium]|nr:DNA polymerase I [Bacteroidales bacterium]
QEVAAAARKAGRCALLAEGVGGGISARAGRMTLAAPGTAPIAASGPADGFRSVLEDAAVIKYGDDLKRATNLLAAEGITLAGPLRDIPLMHYLIDPEKSHAADVLCSSYLGASLEETPAEAPVGSLFDAPEETPQVETDRRKAALFLLLGEKVRAALEEAGLAGLYDDMEAPLLRVLARMEREGVKMDLASLGAFTDMLRDEIATRERRVREMVEEPDLNVSSPKQIGILLFEKLKLAAKPKKNANGTYSTDETTLLDIADRHPVVEEILEFRAAKKLLSTYIEPIPGYIDPADGKIHTTFNQALTATGRLSSSNPNLQNIPIRTERGREIRRAFISARPGGRIVSADYSQIELRIMAHLSCDAHLIEAFRAGIDIHSATAAKIFGIPHEAVSPEERRIAKTANFGILYGISAFGLAQRLRIGRREAQQLIEDYFASFPAIRSYIEDTKAAARETGYVETVFGRKRYLPDINSRNATLRALAERNAVNAPIQGTAADIIKLAMIRVQQEIDTLGLQSRMVLQVHDELVFDAVPEEIPTLKKAVVAGMEGVVQLSVPLTVECNDGDNWLEAH